MKRPLASMSVRIAPAQDDLLGLPGCRLELGREPAVDMEELP
jgi:hypothetical protein